MVSLAACNQPCRNFQVPQNQLLRGFETFVAFTAIYPERGWRVHSKHRNVCATRDASCGPSRSVPWGLRRHYKASVCHETDNLIGALRAHTTTRHKNWQPRRVFLQQRSSGVAQRCPAVRDYSTVCLTKIKAGGLKNRSELSATRSGRGKFGMSGEFH